MEYPYYTDDNTNKIVFVRMRVFYIESPVQECNYCKLFLQSRSYKELKKFGEYLPNIKFLYEEFPCDWQGLNRPRFTDQEVMDSDYEKLGWDLDELTSNYLLSRGYVSNYPAIVMHIFYGDGRIEQKIINGIMSKEDDDTISFEFFQYLKSYFDEYIPKHLKNKFTHDKAKYTLAKSAEPTLRYEENFEIND